MTLSMTSTTKGAPPAALWGLLFVLAGNMLLDALEVSVALVALPSISTDLGLDTPQLQWVVSGFAAGFGGLLLFGGRLVALLGRRPVYLAALAVFAVASLAGALADSAELLVASRFVKGFCAALTAPTGLAIIAAVFPEGPARSRAVAVYSLFGAGGFSAGLLLSGALSEVSWRWAFAFPAPVALLLFAAGLKLIPRDEPGPRPAGGYGAVSALSLTGAVLALVYAITSVPGADRHGARTVGAFALAVLLAVVFVRVELTAREPLVRLELLARKPLVRSALGAGALNGSYLGLLLVCTLHLQQRAGWSPLETGLAFLPASAPLALTALYSGRIVNRFGPARLIAAGAAAAPLGYALYPRDDRADVSYAVDVLPTMLLVGAAFVLAFTAFHLQATAAVPTDRQAAAGGLYQTAVQLGAALVTATVAALHPAGSAPALVLVTAVGLAGFLLALRGVRPRRAVSDTAH
ncbi:MFS transporter [Streptomyces sp. NBC_01351]|uniref:MFS transporter n=1 Tax=Streptomyces sp. NBC_01351 TaxID=2903833 RepID=UPI002E338CA2|nr:MFS transporter [Streptomyces sp. NBC_01351]